MKTIFHSPVLHSRSIAGIAICCLLLSGANANAQALDASQIKSIQASFVKDASTLAIQNVLSNNKDITSLALSRANQNQVDHYFKYRVDVKGITNQKSSGRCWMFTSMNVLRPTVMKKYGINQFDFSHNYCYFWDIFEKSNLFLERIIASSNKEITDIEVSNAFSSPVGDGGVWNLFYNIAEKYGLVPNSVMPETQHSDNTSQMMGIIKECLRGNGYHLREMAASGAKAGAINAEKINALKDVYRILALCLGEPPTEFTWRYKNTDGKLETLQTTPLDFYHSIVSEDYKPENYIMVMNDPTREYYKVYEIQDYRNTYEGINWIYLNLPNPDIKKAALASIKNNEALYVSCDFRKQLDITRGVMDVNNYDYSSLFGVRLDMDKKARILTRQSSSTHAMALVACDTDQNDTPVKWEFENSHGPSSGNQGYITFTDEWFDAYLFRIVIQKQYLDSKAIEALHQQPIQLPAWDYMF